MHFPEFVTQRSLPGDDVFVFSHLFPVLERYNHWHTKASQSELTVLYNRSKSGSIVPHYARMTNISRKTYNYNIRNYKVPF